MTKPKTITVETTLSPAQAQRAIDRYEKLLKQDRYSVYFSTAKTYVKQASLPDLTELQHLALQRLSVVDNSAYEQYIKES